MQDISRLSVIERVRKENPWWNAAIQIAAFPFFEMESRPYLRQLLSLLDVNIQRAVILMGPRRVGKTVLLHHAIYALLNGGDRFTAEKICYVSVDHPLYNSLNLLDFLDIYREATGVDYEHEHCLFVFDEIQYLRNWEQHLKSLVDSYPDLKCVASGSAAAALKLKSNESGAGRFTDLLLPPLTFYEYVTLLKRNELFADCCSQRTDKNGSFLDVTSPLEESDKDGINSLFLDYLNFGGYPEVALNPIIQENPGRFIKNDIVDKVLLRDLPSLYGVLNIQELNYLFTTLAYNTAGEVSLEDLSQKSGVAKPTIKKYIEYLEAAFLIKTVNRIDMTAKRFKRATTFKVYLTNPSIRAALFAPLAENDEVALGAIVETAIFSQWFHDANTRIYYARWPKGEVDIVALDPVFNVRWVCEVKWSDRYFNNPDLLKPQMVFAQKHGLKRFGVTTKTCFGDQVLNGVEITYFPAALYCYVLGYNILHRE